MRTTASQAPPLHPVPDTVYTAYTGLPTSVPKSAYHTAPEEHLQSLTADLSGLSYLATARHSTCRCPRLQVLPSLLPTLAVSFIARLTAKAYTLQNKINRTTAAPLAAGSVPLGVRGISQPQLASAPLPCPPAPGSALALHPASPQPLGPRSLASRAPLLLLLPVQVSRQRHQAPQLPHRVR